MTTGLEKSYSQYNLIAFRCDATLLDANGVFRVDSRGGCQSGHEGAVGSLFGDNRLGLSDCGRLDDCVSLARFTSTQISSKSTHQWCIQ
jgi:hypothetical protein